MDEVLENLRSVNAEQQKEIEKLQVISRKFYNSVIYNNLSFHYILENGRGCKEFGISE
jgi:hypothetical protein